MDDSQRQAVCIRHTTGVEVTVAATAGNQVANLVVDGLEGGARVVVAHEGAAAVNAEGHGGRGKEEDRRELHCECDCGW